MKRDSSTGAFQQILLDFLEHLFCIWLCMLYKIGVLKNFAKFMANFMWTTVLVVGRIGLVWPAATLLMFCRIYCEHGTVIRTGITFKKIPCYMHNPACKWLIVEITIIFRSYAKHFWIFPRERNCRILTGLCKKFSWINQSCFWPRQ